jgi:hypothetical protein
MRASFSVEWTRKATNLFKGVLSTFFLREFYLLYSAHGSILICIRVFAQSELNKLEFLGEKPLLARLQRARANSDKQKKRD